MPPVALWLALVLPLAGPQETPPERLAARCGDGIAWHYDAAPALADAKKQERLVLTIVRTPYRDTANDPRSTERPYDEGEAVETLLIATAFTNPDVMALVSTRFVALRTAIGLRTHHEAAKERRLPDDPLEPLGTTADKVKGPALLFSTPDGKCVRTFDRIGVFDPQVVYRLCREVLSANPGLSKPKGRTADELLAEGELERAAEAYSGSTDAGLYGRARAAALGGDHEKAIGIADRISGRFLGDAQIQKGASLIRLGRFDEAEEALNEALDLIPAPPRTAEAIFLLACLRQSAGKESEAKALWDSVCERSPASPWAWKSAARLEPKSWQVPYLREYEALVSPGFPRTLGESTEHGASPAKLKEVLPRSIDYLIASQRADGSWRPLHHYEWPGITPQTVAITAIAADALVRWDGSLKGTRRARAREAVRRAVAHIDDFLEKAPILPRYIYDDCYALALFNERWRRTRDAKDKARIQKISDRLLATQYDDGQWSYLSNRGHSFDTANALIQLVRARTSGAKVPDGRIESAVEALERMRKDDGSFAYWIDRTWPNPQRPADGSWMWTVHASAARAPICEHAILAGGGGSKEQLQGGIEIFLKHRDELESPRKIYFHHFNRRGHGAYFHLFAYRHAAEAMLALGEEAPEGGLRQIRDELLTICEIDGTWIDMYKVGKAYGTATALITLSLIDSER